MFYKLLSYQVELCISSCADVDIDEDLDIIVFMAVKSVAKMVIILMGEKKA